MAIPTINIHLSVVGSSCSNEGEKGVRWRVPPRALMRVRRVTPRPLEGNRKQHSLFPGVEVRLQPERSVEGSPSPGRERALPLDEKFA